jgi:hypothetical protein
MRGVCSLIWLALIGLFRSRASLQAEILTLRHQLNVLRRKSPQRLTFTSVADLAGPAPCNQLRQPSRRIGAPRHGMELSGSIRIDSE